MNSVSVYLHTINNKRINRTQHWSRISAIKAWIFKISCFIIQTVASSRGQWFILRGVGLLFGPEQQQSSVELSRGINKDFFSHSLFIWSSSCQGALAFIFSWQLSQKLSSLLSLLAQKSVKSLSRRSASLSSPSTPVLQALVSMVL